MWTLLVLCIPTVAVSLTRTATREMYGIEGEPVSWKWSNCNKCKETPISGMKKEKNSNIIYFKNIELFLYIVNLQLLILISNLGTYKFEAKLDISIPVFPARQKAEPSRRYRLWKLMKINFCNDNEICKYDANNWNGKYVIVKL